MLETCATEYFNGLLSGPAETVKLLTGVPCFRGRVSPWLKVTTGIGRESMPPTARQSDPLGLLIGRNRERPLSGSCLRQLGATATANSCQSQNKTLGRIHIPRERTRVPAAHRSAAAAHRPFIVKV